MLCCCDKSTTMATRVVDNAHITIVIIIHGIQFGIGLISLWVFTCESRNSTTFSARFGFPLGAQKKFPYQCNKLFLRIEWKATSMVMHHAYFQMIFALLHCLSWTQPTKLGFGMIVKFWLCIYFHQLISQYSKADACSSNSSIGSVRKSIFRIIRIVI